MKNIQNPIKIEKDDSFKVIFSKYGAYAFDKQENLANIIEDSQGILDLDNGTLTFNKDIKFNVQILAFYSEEFNRWSWGWDSESLGINDEFINDSKKIKEIGKEFDIKEFITPSFEIDFNDSHIIAMISSSLLDVDAYYMASIEDLEVFLTIRSDLIKEDNSAERFRLTFNNFQKNFDVFKRIAFEGYTKLKGYEFKQKDEFSLAKIGNDRVIVGFSDRGSITHIQLLEAD
ncbi:MAG: hypothetical protein KO202_02840 [Methanobacteriaceae archaeon]|jgi:hypothetical protein|nr:hypothetical protein [Methanobacteriaceae archaeon]